MQNKGSAQVTGYQILTTSYLDRKKFEILIKLIYALLTWLVIQNWLLQMNQITDSTWLEHVTSW